MISIEQIRIKDKLVERMSELRSKYITTKDVTLLTELDQVRRKYYDIMCDIYSANNVQLAGMLLGDQKNVRLGDLLIYVSKDQYLFRDMSKNTENYDFKPVEIKPDTRSDDEIVYEFILENQTHGIDCTKKFIESMLTGKISKSHIIDTLVRLTLIGLDGKFLELVDSTDPTIKDKVYRIKK